MSKVFVNIGLSLDGYMAPEGMTMENWDRPGYKDWGAKWGALMSWILNQQYFRENLKLGPGGETGPVNDMLRNTTERIGANIMGKRMFDAGERSWPEDAPFHTPVYVLTHEKREPWVRPGGTTFYFVNDDPESALEQARESAGSRDIRIAGGADVIQQYLNLGVIDELEIALAPVVFGGGRRLSRTYASRCSGFELTRCMKVRLLRTCAMCVSKGGVTLRSSGPPPAWHLAREALAVIIRFAGQVPSWFRPAQLKRWASQTAGSPAVRYSLTRTWRNLEQWTHQWGRR